jgi:hypothetical protein
MGIKLDGRTPGGLVIDSSNVSATTGVVCFPASYCKICGKLITEKQIENREAVEHKSFGVACISHHGVSDLYDNLFAMEEERSLMVFECGPSSEECECHCPDSCGHQWDGEPVEYKTGNLTCGTVTCSKCGMFASEHDVWVLP